MEPTPVFLPGKFHGQKSLVGYSPWGFKRGTTEGLNNDEKIRDGNLFFKLRTGSVQTSEEASSEKLESAERNTYPGWCLSLVWVKREGETQYSSPRHLETGSPR